MVWLSEGKFLPGCRAEDKRLKVWNLKPVITQPPRINVTANAQRKPSAWTAAIMITTPGRFYQVPPSWSCRRDLARRYGPPILCIGKLRHREMWWLGPNHEWGNQEENSVFWHPDQFFVVCADSSQTGNWPTCNSPGCSKSPAQGKVSSIHYFHLKVWPLRNTGNHKGSEVLNICDICIKPYKFSAETDTETVK